MPIYCYKCKKCGEETKIFLSIKDELKKCLKCGSEDIKKIFQNIFTINKEEIEKRKKVGDIVKRHIENEREEIKEMKKELKRKGSKEIKK